MQTPASPLAAALLDGPPGAAALLVAAPLLLAAALPLRRSGLRAAVAAATASLALAVLAAVTGAVPPVQAAATVFAAALVTVVTTFSRRHLDGDPKRGRYRRVLLVTSAASVVVLAADDLVVLAVAWVATGWGLTALVAHHDDLEASRRAVRALRRTRLAGHVAFALALGLLAAAAGTTSLAGVVAAAGGRPGLVAAALALLVVAVAGRSAQLPFSRWLPLSVVAPAPVSALAHAGIVNAPLVVLLTLEPLWRSVSWFAPVLLAVGLATAVLTFPRLLVRADVKTRLAWSTTAQLGFMLALVAVGAHAAALVHAALHGIYKANAFLRAGEDLSVARRDALPVAPARTRWWGAAAGAAAGAALLAADRAWEQPLTAVAVLVAATAGGYGLAAPRARAGVRVAAAALAVVVLGAVLLAGRLAAGALGLPLEAHGAPAWAAAGVVAALAAAAAVVLHRRPVRVWAWLHRAADPVVGTAEVLRARAGRRPRAVLPAPGPLDAREVRTIVGVAADVLPPVWDWRGFVASNPLWGGRSRPFAAAVAAAPAAPRAADVVDDAVAGWLAAWAARGGVPWPAPAADRGLWDWFRLVGPADPLLAGAWPARLPDDPADVLRAVLPADAAHDAVRTELLALTGWSAYLARRGTTAAAVDVDVLVDLLAVRVVTRLVVTGRPLRPAATSASAGSREVVAGLEEREAAVRSALAVQLAGRAADGPPVGGPAPQADLVFCIDTRSEVLRRHLEALGPWRTKGFAGFFGLPAQRLAGAAASDRLPALLAPAVRVSSGPPPAGVRDLLASALRTALDTPGGGFAAVDLAAVRGLAGLLGAVRPVLRRRPAAAPAQVLATDRAAALAAAVGAARAIGLGPDAAPLVVLVGHGSTSTNNTAESAFDCGACGGHRGGFNARVVAGLLDAPDGRAALAAAGIPLPAGTVVLAAEHDTGLDRVVLLDPPDDQALRPALARLQAALGAAGARTALERSAALPGTPPGSARAALAAARSRCADPAQVRHEWGLAGNAAFVAAPRDLTRGLDLRGRAFLHEYDPAADADGSGLEQIMTAPLVVAHWINSQYLFSALDPQRWGAGSKTAHNPVGRLGVLAGPGGDLRTGLAEQSVRYDGVAPFPVVRLLAVLAAGPDRIDAVLARHADLAALVDGEWLTVWSVDPVGGALRQRTASGWQPVLVPARVPWPGVLAPAAARALAPVG